MSNTTCIKAINTASQLSEGTVNKLYNHIHTPQPCKVSTTPVGYHHMGHIVQPLDVLVNSTVHAKDRDDTDIYSYHIYGNVYVTYIKEGLSL